MSMASRAVPGLACASAAKPASAISVKSTTGALCRSTTTTSRPFDSFARCGAGSFSDGGAPVVGSLLRSTVLATVLNVRHRLDVEHEHAIGHPALGRALHVGRRGARDPVEPRLVEIRRAAVHLALGEDRRLAAEAIDALDAAREVRVVSRADALELRRASGPVARKRATSSSSAFSTAAGSPPGFTVTMICSCEPISNGPDAGDDRGRGAIRVHQALVEPAVLAAAQHVGWSCRACVKSRCLIARDVPHLIYARLRHGDPACIARCVPVIFAIQSCWRLITGPAGMSPKYFSTFCLASAAVMSPAITQHRVGGAVVRRGTSPSRPRATRRSGLPSSRWFPRNTDGRRDRCWR